MKKTKSMFDKFSDKLDGWLNDESEGGEGITYAQACSRLSEFGCAAKVQTLSDWWKQRRQTLDEARLLSQIGRGAQQVKKVRSEFSENAPPDLEMLIDLHRVLVLQMSTQAVANPEMIKLADQGLRTVMEFVSGQTKARLKERELTLAEGKWAWVKKEDLDKALAALLEELKALPGGTEIYQRFDADIRTAREKAKK